MYIDLSFYRDLRDSYGAPGDFAQAYVIAHEVGHHVQNQIGIMEQVNSAQQQASSSQVDANRLSVLLDSCKLIVLRASGHITPTGLETFSSKAT